MTWYITGPSVTVLVVAVAAVHSREIVPEWQRTRYVVGPVILSPIALGLILIDLAR
jgi:hypothetical protein